MGNLSTPDSVQKLQTALHAKAKAEPGYRFYALYDKLSREDILAHAYAQCRSNKGAPGVDRQDFEAVEAYGVERWLGELALALRQETYPDRTPSDASTYRRPTANSGVRLEPSPSCRPSQVGSAPDRRSARASSDQDVAGLPSGRNRRSGSEDAHDRGAGQAARHSAGLAPLTLAGQISTCAGSCWDGRCSGWSEP